MTLENVLTLTYNDLLIKLEDSKKGVIKYFDYPTRLSDFKEYLNRKVKHIDIEVIFEDEYYLSIMI